MKEEILGRVNAVIESLNNVFEERKTEVNLMTLGLVANEHVCLLGPPGVGKTALAEQFSTAFGLKSWSYLLTKMTSDSEVFGPINVKAMADDGELKRITTAKMPEAEIAVLDEIFKANSAILNSLLRILNEKVYDNPTPQKVPLKMAIGLSNEMPEGQGELDALFDRFILRTWVQPVSTRASKRKLMRMTGAPKITARSTISDIEYLRGALESVLITTDLEDIILNLIEKITDDKIYVSDRRLRKAIKVIKANAVLSGRAEAQTEDLWPLSYLLWSDPEDMTTIDKMVTDAVDPDLSYARTQLGFCIKLYREAEDMVKGSSSLNPQEANAKFGPNLLAKYAEIKQAAIEIALLNKSPKVIECLQRAEDMAQKVRDHHGRMMDRAYTI